MCKVNPMRLVLCRHGETNLNAQKRLQGWVDTSLNERGRMQARLTGEHLRNEKFDCAFCSPLNRTRETFAEIMRFHEGTPFYFRDELREINIGIYSGMDRREIEEKYPGRWAKRVDRSTSSCMKAGRATSQWTKPASGRF
ncbi:2,3-bisphosphoglycerate-dependent phosphoglycerate mutase [uncultured archaeon]|nr:2,3-bisphosphoglycerate-dependent phosphoglycerate mutase [uncultured archaeon]